MWSLYHEGKIFSFKIVQKIINNVSYFLALFDFHAQTVGATI